MKKRGTKSDIMHTMTRNIMFYLGSSKSKIYPIWGTVQVSHCQYQTRWTNSSVSSSQFLILPQYELAVGRLPKTISRIVWLFCPDVTSSPNGHCQDFPVCARVLKGYICCHTADLFATTILLFSCHGPAYSTSTPWRSLHLLRREGLLH